MEIKTFRVSQAGIINQCYLASQDNIGILIDPSWDYALINDYMTTHHIRPAGVLLTHAHFDHTDLAAAFANAYQIPVWMSDVEITHSGFQCPQLQAVTHLQEIVTEGIRIKVLLTPGHTPGSTCYLTGGHLFSGDTVFMEGVGICSEESVHDLYNSVQLLKHYLPAGTHFWPGHSFGEKPGKDLLWLKKHNIYFQLDDREHFCTFRMRKNRPDPFLFK